MLQADSLASELQGSPYDIDIIYPVEGQIWFSSSRPNLWASGFSSNRYFESPTCGLTSWFSKSQMQDSSPDKKVFFTNSITCLQGGQIPWSTLCSHVVSHSVVSDSVTPWTVARQAPMSMEISRQEYWSGLPFPSPEDLPNPGIEPRSHALHWSSALANLENG